MADRLISLSTSELSLLFEQPLDKALEFLKKKGLYDYTEFYSDAMERLRDAAFAVAGITDMTVLEDIWEQVQRAEDEGLYLSEFQDSIDGIFAKLGWTSLSPHHIENILRSNLLSAYNHGRFEMQLDGAELTPYLAYSAILDSKTRPSHRKMDFMVSGIVYRVDDPIWRIWYPPNGYFCRCIAIAMTAAQVEARGLKIAEVGTMTPIVRPDKYWESAPMNIDLLKERQYQLRSFFRRAA